MSEKPKPFEGLQSHFNKSVLDSVDEIAPDYWGELRTLLAVSKTGSFNKAAETLNASAPTVSRHIKRLEDIMGFQLTVQTKTGVKLTDRGKLLAKKSAQMNNIVAAATELLKKDVKQLNGIVRVSMTDGMSSFWLAPELPDIFHSNPQMDIHVSSSNQFLDLHENQSDVVVSFLPQTDRDVRCEQVGSLHFVPFAAKSYIEKYGFPNKGNLEQHRFMHMHFYSEQMEIWNGWNALRARGITCFYADSSVLYALTARAGGGICLLGTYVSIDPAYVPLDLGFRAVQPIYVSALKERLKESQVEFIYNRLCDILGRQNPWFHKEFSIPTDGEWNQRQGFDLDLFNRQPSDLI